MELSGLPEIAGIEGDGFYKFMVFGVIDADGQSR